MHTLVSFLDKPADKIFIPTDQIPTVGAKFSAIEHASTGIIIILEEHTRIGIELEPKEYNTIVGELPNAHVLAPSIPAILDVESMQLLGLLVLGMLRVTYKFEAD